MYLIYMRILMFPVLPKEGATSYARLLCVDNHQSGGGLKLTLQTIVLVCTIVTVLVSPELIHYYYVFVYLEYFLLICYMSFRRIPY